MSLHNDNDLTAWAQREALIAIQRAERQQEDFAAPWVREDVVHMLEDRGVLLSTLRWTESIPDTREMERNTIPSDEELAAEVLAMPDALDALGNLLTRADRDCTAKGLHPIGINLQTRSRVMPPSMTRHRIEQTELVITVRAVDRDKLLQMRDGES